MPKWLTDLYRSLSGQSTSSRYAGQPHEDEPVSKTEQEHEIRMATVDAEQARLEAERVKLLARVAAAQDKYNAYEKPTATRRRQVHA